ncbi:uncharacterized protein LOC106180733 [Lingula anatina]|uniref:Uncharacterized protein LOC106180733 n=1 Tax=Lingula anatina TaxID=7574 RepID=A0A1S3KCR3_LINAN|nr:uncharacterized protein LOC106180733 [Lingula anatina]|eukprot:XP_013420282.1 uncharacterized protein LOC106180733 [Lingula anatina]
MLLYLSLLIGPLCVLSINQSRPSYRWGYFESHISARLANGVFGGGAAKTFTVQKRSECTTLCMRLGPESCVSVSFNSAELICEVYDKTTDDDSNTSPVASEGWEYLNPKFGPPQKPIIWEAKSPHRNTIEVSWAPDVDGGFEQTITLDIKLQNADDSTYVTKLTVTNPEYLVNVTTILTDLVENLFYTLRFTSTNTRTVGINNASVTVDVQTFSDGFTCERWKSEGSLTSGTYTIDPDGNGPVTSFDVDCDMTFDPPLTIVHHSIEGRSSQLGPSHSGYYYRSLSYSPATTDHVVALVDKASHCHQFRKFECHGVGNTGSGTDQSDRDGAYQFWGAYFAGGSPVSKCLCGKYSACRNGRSDCACMANDVVWRESAGYLQEKVVLPIVNTRISDIDGTNEMGFETLGPVVCSSWPEGREHPLGMENSLIADSALSASNTDSSSQCTVTNGRVGSAFDAAWCPPAANLDTDQWFQVDLGKVMVVTKVATQGQAGPSNRWVTKYSLLFSNLSYTNFECYTSGNGTCKVFNGNWDGDAVRTNYLRPAGTGRYIRFNPKAWNTHISLRAEVYGFEAGYTNTSDIPTGQSVTLTCPTGTWLDIQDAFYGDESQNCRATQKNAIKAVKTPCQQRSTCTVTSGTSLFGDPCSSVSSKYMWITYKCVSILSSCYEYYMHGFTYSGPFEIDPDGPNNGVGPFIVECDMTSTPPGKTLIHHNRESESGTISGHENCAGSGYTATVTYYGVTLTTHIPPFMNTVGACSQFGKYRCNAASGVGTTCTWAKDRGGTQIPYWAGGNANHKCACGVAGTCDNGRTDCSCNQNDNAERVDQGYFTDKSLLPVSFIHVGDTGDASEWGRYTFGPLECEPALPSCTEWKRFTSTSGTYWVDPDGGGGVDAFQVQCDMSTNPPTATFSHDHEARTHVSGYDPALSYSATLTYDDASVEQVATYVDYVGESCTQHVKYECYHSVISVNNGTLNYAAWYDRNGQVAQFWPGGDPDGVPFNCACSQNGTCASSAHNCNCDLNDSTWRADEGDVTDPSYLPVSKVEFGDTGGGEEGYHTVGPLVCRG